MSIKVLVIGAPRSGKSTLLDKLISNFWSDYDIRGFITPEVRKKGKRIGFNILDIYTNDKVVLARSGKYNTQHKLGKYHVNLENFEKFLQDNFRNQLSSLKDGKKNLIFIDEIGKMELFSKKFEEIIKNLFISDKNIISTIGKNLVHPIKDYLFSLPNVRKIHLNLNNREKIFQELKNVLKKI